MTWLRSQNCVVSEEKAECAHHVRVGTNGGCSLRPSDYFCIPLINRYHTTGGDALHIIGELTFYKKYNIDYVSLFVKYLTQYLSEKFHYSHKLNSQSNLDNLFDLINIMEMKRKISRKSIVKVKKVVSEESKKFQMVARERKKKYEKEYLKKNQMLIKEYKKNQMDRLKEFKKQNHILKNKETN